MLSFVGDRCATVTGLLNFKKSEGVIMYSLAQACPIPVVREKLMLEIELMQLYTVLYNLEAAR